MSDRSDTPDEQWLAVGEYVAAAGGHMKGGYRRTGVAGGEQVMLMIGKTRRAIGLFLAILLGLGVVISPATAAPTGPLTRGHTHMELSAAAPMAPSSMPQPEIKAELAVMASAATAGAASIPGGINFPWQCLWQWSPWWFTLALKYMWCALRYPDPVY